MRNATYKRRLQGEMGILPNPLTYTKRMEVTL